VLNEIKKIYNEEINDKLKGYKKNTSDSFTISVGAAIAHYKQPLPMVLDMAKEMETKAKDSGRNRFAFGVMKHSGNVSNCVFPWDKEEKSPLKLLDKITQSVLSENFSTAYLRNIYNAFENYGFTMSSDLVKSKINLYVPRAANKHNGKEENINELKETLNSLLSCTDNIEFGNALLIIDFLKRKTNRNE
jgi:CRISPR/Cas system-associated protein Cas10 (large subunit of type III CRISPR-Cas system)